MVQIDIIWYITNKINKFKHTQIDFNDLANNLSPSGVIYGSLNSQFLDF